MSDRAYCVVGYIRVSTAEQADSGAGLEAQRAAIEAEAVRRGWTLLRTFEDAGASGKSSTARPRLSSLRSSTVSHVRCSTSRHSWSGDASEDGASSPSTSELTHPHHPAR